MVVVTRHSTIQARPSEYVPTADRRVALRDVSWHAYKQFMELRGDVAGPRVAYLKGTLELMSPSRDHESIKRVLACVVDEYLDSLGIPFDGAGSWLLEDDVTEVALEPDETFVLHDVRKQRPDLAIEVVWTSGGVSKLAIYRHLQIGEVWIWKDDVLTFYVLGESGYEEREHSACVPGFDKQLAYDMLELEALGDVRRALRERLRR